ncbi:MAG: right-handed parallel beta-helix repeat-containing protein [Acidobacteriota bacterium]
MRLTLVYSLRLVSVPLLAFFLTPTVTGAATFTITDFGAVAGDGIDDRAAIQATLDAACSAVSGGDTDVEVVVPAGVFDLEKGPEPGSTEPWVILPLDCGGFTLRGEPHPTGDAGGLSTLRLADSQGSFESILATPDFNEPLDNFILRDLTLDGNGANNPIIGGDDALADLLRDRRHALRTYLGSGVHVESARFTGWRTSNVLFFAGSAVANISVKDSRFDAVGQPPGVGLDWNHITIYALSDGALIDGNTFESLGPGTFGARAAVQIQGSDQTVRGNRVQDFTTGVNLAAATSIGLDGAEVESNQFLGVADGVRLRASVSTGVPNGTVLLENAAIRSNRIEIAVDAWRGTQDPDEQANRGVSLVETSTGGLANLEITGNSITFTDFGAAPRNYDRDSAGVRLVAEAVPDLPIQGLTISGNTIRNALAKGIHIAAALTAGALIEANRIVDAGVGPASLTIFERSAFEFEGSYGDVDVLDTCIVDADPAGPRLAQTLLLRPTSNSGNRILGTAIELAGGSLPFLVTVGLTGSPWTIQPPTSPCPGLFADGFEFGDTSAWTATVTQ